ncbi:MAG: GNAT family N-acetyltransferase [Solobacterium sp.]|nr:GNAT family N-acetyltransferase [Solobacterium sp.]
MKETGKVIGNIYCGKRDFEDRDAGYIVNQHYQRLGYASEALSAVIKEFLQNGIHRIYAECDPRNISSWKLLEKAGME